MKKYMRWMLNEQAAMAKSIESLWHNQQVLQWTVIEQQQAIKNLTSSSSSSG